MTLILVHRYLSTAEATLSRIYVDGQFMAFGLEDAFQETKIKGQTRIPAGVYKVTLRTEGGTHARYLKRRDTRVFHEGMLWVRDVPGFEYILIHIGNDAADTDGCLLVGLIADETTMTLSSSALAYAAFYRRVLPAAKGGNLSIEYRDDDR